MNDLIRKRSVSAYNVNNHLFTTKRDAEKYRDELTVSVVAVTGDKFNFFCEYKNIQPEKLFLAGYYSIINYGKYNIDTKSEAKKIHKRYYDFVNKHNISIGGISNDMPVILTGKYKDLRKLETLGDIILTNNIKIIK